MIDHHPDMWRNRDRRWVKKVYWSPPTRTWHSTYASLSQELNRFGIDQEAFFLEYGSEQLKDIYEENRDPVLGNARNEPYCLECQKSVKFNRARHQYPAFCSFSCSTSWYAQNTSRIETAMATNENRKRENPDHQLGKIHLRYWTNQGLTEEEARERVRQRQQTFRLDKLIAKHGEDEGRRIWQDRQDRWLTSFMKSRSINDSHTISSVSRSLFDKLAESFPSLKYGKDEKIIFASGRSHRVDCWHPETGRIIEFYGDYYHGNPLKYKAEDQIRNRTASEQWQLDESRIARLKTNKNVGGVLVVWEHDWRTNPSEVMERCLSFLHG